MKKIIFYLKELYLEYSNQVPSYIKIGERQKWLKEQEEEFIPLFVSEADTDLWRKKQKKLPKISNY